MCDLFVGGEGLNIGWEEIFSYSVYIFVYLKKCLFY
jgi:hypothetical protein